MPQQPLDTILAQVDCAWCGETGDVVVDPSAGANQSYVEDCWVCCRPNVLMIEIDPEGHVTLGAEQE